MKIPQGQALIHEACDEVQKIMLMQMVEEQRQALAQAQKEYQSLQKPKEDTIKSLQKELKSLRTRLLKLQTQKAQVKQGLLKPEDTPKPNSIENWRVCVVIVLEIKSLWLCFGCVFWELGARYCSFSEKLERAIVLFPRKLPRRRASDQNTTTNEAKPRN